MTVRFSSVPSQFGGRTLWGGQRSLTSLPLPPTSREDLWLDGYLETECTIHLQPSMSSPGFEPRTFEQRRLKAWANWAWSRTSASVGTSFSSQLSLNMIMNNFNGRMLFPDIFSEGLGISNYKSTGNSGKTALLGDDHCPCLEIGLPP
ncbi:hypothetical protein TNCV_529201 [Trichonephila clavipes]|nr:hypothetical protein TNCV_529201 [Trichonephila clavipes]